MKQIRDQKSDISPCLNGRGFSPSRVSFPVSLERAVASTAGLTSPPQAFAFPESQGSFSIWESRNPLRQSETPLSWLALRAHLTERRNVVFVPVHRLAWFSQVGSRKRVGMVKHASAFTQANDLAWNSLFRLPTKLALLPTVRQSERKYPQTLFSCQCATRAV